jgi:hypothetical protein
MNYLCHARDCLGRPWVLAGAVLPDWVRIVAPAARIRPWMVSGVAADPGTARAGIFEGLSLHFEDDGWFHVTDAFHDVTGAIAGRIRARHPDRPERRMRASFYAHLLLEMLLDGWLARARPGSAEAFAAAVRSLDRETLAAEVAKIAPAAVPRLLEVVDRFGARSVIEGYLDDEEVTRRLDIMGRRVRQPDLPGGFVELTAAARGIVAGRAEDLLLKPLG